MVSGIGPKETLEGLNIPVLADLAGVGQNMWVSQLLHMGQLLCQKFIKSQDHIAFSPAYAVGLTTHSHLASPSFAAAQTAEYIANRTGILTNVGGDILGLSIKRDLASLAEFYHRFCESSIREY